MIILYLYGDIYLHFNTFFFLSNLESIITHHKQCCFRSFCEFIKWGGKIKNIIINNKNLLEFHYVSLLSVEFILRSFSTIKTFMKQLFEQKSVVALQWQHCLRLEQSLFAGCVIKICKFWYDYLSQKEITSCWNNKIFRLKLISL